MVSPASRPTPAVDANPTTTPIPPSRCDITTRMCVRGVVSSDNSSTPTPFFIYGGMSSATDMATPVT